MKKIELVKGIQSSVLGFGCAPILGSVDGKLGRKALECAFEHGVNHLDLARSYGYGEAERFVGNLIQGKRDKIVIASKFGIKANWKAKILRPIKPLVRIVRKPTKKELTELVQNKNSVTPVADLFHDRINLNEKEMRKSLETSLRSLRTDYLDYFFIHEPLDTILRIEELLETAEILKKEGKIRALGLAFMRNQQHLHENYLKRFDILQFNNSPGSEGYQEIFETRRNEPNVMFSPLRGGSAQLKPDEKLKQLFTDFPRSVVLCSMFNERHIIANSQLAN